MSKPKSQYIIIYTTFPHRRQARRLAMNLIKEKLVACANIFKIDAIYKWEEKLEESREYSVFLKTLAELYPKVEKRIKELHPNEIPCIISWKIEQGSKDFLDWIANNVEA